MFRWWNFLAQLQTSQLNKDQVYKEQTYWFQETFGFFQLFPKSALVCTFSSNSNISSLAHLLTSLLKKCKTLLHYYYTHKAGQQPLGKNENYIVCLFFFWLCRELKKSQAMSVYLSIYTKVLFLHLSDSESESILSSLPWDHNQSL